MEIVSECIVRFIDEKIDNRLLGKSNYHSLRRMKQLTMEFKTNKPVISVGSYLQDNLDEFENMLRSMGYLKSNEGIGAYHTKEKTLILLVVKKIGSALLM